MEGALGRPVSRETRQALEHFVSLLEREAAHQNLVSARTLQSIWVRHIIDSAQLLRLVPGYGTWVDVGSGAGLPGLVIAILTQNPITLVEPRRLRAEFLARCVSELGLSQVQVATSRIERVHGKFDFITARAVAPLPKLLGITSHLMRPNTRFILPKGRMANSELAEASRNWQYDVELEQSCTDPDSLILLLSNVKAKP